MLKQKTPAPFDEVVPLRGREKPTGHKRSNEEGMKEDETVERNGKGKEGGGVEYVNYCTNNSC